MSVTAPLRSARAVGVNVTLIVHVPPFAATGVEVEHVVPLVAGAKSPLYAMLEIASGELPLFVSVNDWAGLVTLKG